MDIRIFCCLFVVCIYMFGWLCRATYCSVVSTSMLGVSHAVQNEKKLLEFTQSDSVYLLHLLRCLVYQMLFKTRRSFGSLHRVIGEVLVLGLLVAVYKIPYSSCMFNTAVVLEPGKMQLVCARHTTVYLVQRVCLS